MFRCPFAKRVHPLSRCPFASELCPRQEKRSQKTKPRATSKSVANKTPPLKEGRRSADKRIHREAASKSDAARVLSPFLRYGRIEAQNHGARTSWSGRARLSAPHRGTRRVSSRLGFRAAFPGITGCKREDPLRHQCSEHLAVRHAPDGTLPKPPARAVYGRASREPLPLRLKEYPRDKASFVERDAESVTVMETNVNSLVIGDAS